jgi:hypothetical protein
MWNHYKEKIAKLERRSDDASPLEELLIWINKARNLSCYYAPFDHVNKQAKIILVGITPGATQMNRSLNAARAALENGEDVSDGIRAVKKFSSFSGIMRHNLISLLDRLGYNSQLGLDSTSHLWNSRDDLVHFCSLLKYPVFFKERDYNGQPKALRVPELKQLIEKEFVSDLSLIDYEAELVPLGNTVGEVITKLNSDGKIPQRLRSFEGKLVCPPHPSGANAESIALILLDRFPMLEEYQDEMYKDYLTFQPWKRKGGMPQQEDKYKRARKSRWEGALFIRRAYRI